MRVLELAGLSAGYGSLPVLRDVTLAVEEGEFVAMVGPNGAGKTTLLRVVSGALPASAGHVEVLGADVRHTPTHRLAAIGLAHVPEDRQVFARMTVLDNLKTGAHPSRARPAFRENLDKVYSVFPILRDKARQRAGSLSGGQQQMLSIARALMSAPRLMLLDEPSLGLSPRTTGEVFAAIETINRLGVSVLLVEQNVGRALALTSRAVVLERGTVVMAGPSATLARDSHIVRAYLGLRRSGVEVARINVSATGGVHDG
jgi:branched-chain amino acid transport system ATP-binding protein